MDGARSRRPRRRSADARLHGLGRAGPPGDPHRGFPRSAAIVPIAGAAADRDLAPVYPGITESDTLADWDPPFPIRSAARPPDRRGLLEAIPHDAEGVHPARCRRSGCGARATAIARRSASSPPADQIAGGRARPLRGAAAQRRRSAVGWAVGAADARGDGLAASRGATDFGEYFTVLQLLPGDLGAAARRRCSSGSASSSARARSACCAPSASPRRGSAASSPPKACVLAVDRQRDRDRRRHRLRRPDDGRPRLLVDRRRRHDRAAGSMCRRSRCRRRASAGSSPRWRCIWWTLRGLVACFGARACSRGCSLTDAGRAGEPGPAHRDWRSTRARVGFAVLGPRADRSERREGDRPDRRLFRRRQLAADRLPVPRRVHRCGGRARRRAPGTRLVADRRGWASATPPIGPGRSVLAIAVIASATFILISVDAFRRAAPSTRAIGTSGVGGYAAACRPARCRWRTIPTAARGASARPDVVPERARRAVPRPARRRCELSESVRADQPAHPRRAARLHRRRHASRSRARSQPPTPSAPIPGCCSTQPARPSRRGRAGDRRRELDDLRAAQEARRRHRHRSRRATADPAAPRRGARRQRLQSRAGHVGRQFPARSFPTSRATSSC